MAYRLLAVLLVIGAGALGMACGSAGTPAAPKVCPGCDSGSPPQAPKGCRLSPLDNDASASPPLVAEAGFIDLPPQPTQATYSARMFYVFQPADTDAAHKPLAVFFNGGPAFPTSMGLLAYGTGRVT